MNDVLDDQSKPILSKPKSLWHRFIESIGYNQRFFWTSFWFLVGFAILIVPIFCASAAGKILVAPALLWAFAFLMLGALFGFIFGVPTIITSGLPSSGLNQTPEQLAAGSKAAEKIVQANTNLTQISDWLTKVIVGAGLVQLGTIPTQIKYVAGKMAKGMVVSDLPSAEAFAAVFSGGIIILFSTYGFIFGYLIMRIILTEIFAS